MTHRLFIIHGWSGNPEEGWFPWLKKTLEADEWEVHVPSMPHPDAPDIRTWIAALRKQVGKPDRHTFFVGHSIGCQTILRYLETLPDEAEIGGCIFVAGWVHLTPAAMPDDDARTIAKPWLETPLRWHRIRNHAEKFVAIFSDNDPYVPLQDMAIFRNELAANIMMERKKGHLGGDDKIVELPVVLTTLKKMSETNRIE